MIFGPGTPDDYPAIEALLAQTDMPGWISLSFQVDLAAGPPHPDALSHIVIARDGDQIVATASCTTMPSPAGPVSWIGGLRVAPALRGQAGVMRRGLNAIRSHLLADPPDWQLAAVLSGNLPAQSLLKRKSENFPTFQPLIDLTTFAMRPKPAKTKGVRRAELDDLHAVAALLAKDARPLSPGITRNTTFAGWADLDISDFLVAEADGRIVGAVALWDQRASRRFVVTGYNATLQRLRPLWNLASPVTGQPRLPAVGQALDAAFLSFLTAPDADVAKNLIRAGLALGAEKGLSIVNLGLAGDDPLRLMVARKFRHQTYDSTIYGVTWPNGRALPPPAFFAQSKVELALL